MNGTSDIRLDNGFNGRLWLGLNDIMKAAFTNYALACDAELLDDIWKGLEDLADQITKLITLMERYGCEDGLLSDYQVSAHFIHKIKRVEARGEKIWNLAGMCAPPERLKELGLLDEQCQFQKEMSELRGGEVRSELGTRNGRGLVAQQDAQILRLFGELHDVVLKCSLVTNFHFSSAYNEFLTFILDESPWRHGALPSVATWKQSRRNLWKMADLLYENTKKRRREYSEKRPGHPRHGHTEDLFYVAASQNLAIPELARMLVELNLDPDDGKRPNTIPRRIERQRKILTTFVDNREKKPRRASPVDI